MLHGTWRDLRLVNPYKLKEKPDHSSWCKQPQQVCAEQAGRLSKGSQVIVAKLNLLPSSGLGCYAS